MEPTTTTERLRNNRGKRNSKEVVHSVNVLPESAQCMVDPDNVFGIVGIVGTVLNLLVVALVYVYTAI
ncbi:hypothetical protein D9C73_015227 [Collichthys lucidus]|uniref:Uncharacterized protein n=1 Tax=Collichthys lucidus TaxID=240159 RepID=A0A4U5V0H5_COLLU|nr:hypothetical protein D9C73_015227 [Collichthys lucidus]